MQTAPKDLDNYLHENISQEYIVIAEDGTEVRLRAKGEKYFQTIKRGLGKSRTETEVELTEKQFEILKGASTGIGVQKTRYNIPYGTETIELDIYLNILKGLITAEVEFESEDASNKFVIPEWFGREVTDDKKYKNQSLALHGMPKDAE